MMTDALDAACAELGAVDDVARTMMKSKITAAVVEGERSTERLKMLALNVIDGRAVDG